ncbi:MAG: hypothetical protein ABR955_00180 [Verrucomicrobiota bacterium]|jgi:hypothetical protein
MILPTIKVPENSVYIMSSSETVEILNCLQKAEIYDCLEKKGAVAENLWDYPGDLIQNFLGTFRQARKDS